MKVEFHNDWKPNKKRFRFFDFQFDLAFFQVCLLFIEVVLYYKPLGYDLAFGILGFSICLWNYE